MRDTIKNHNDFHMVEDDPSARAKMFVVRAKRAKIPGDPRVGFMATKHTFKLAVHRNRAKRLLREWVRFHEGLLVPEFDYVFYARSPILNTDRKTGRVAMHKALQHILKKYAPKTATNMAKIFKNSVDHRNFND